MSEDYLWDKTGSDTEIENLESILSGFAYKETEPPPLPAKVLTLPEVKPRWFFSLRLGFALACVAILSVGLGWLVFTRKPPANNAENIEVSQPSPASTITPDAYNHPESRDESSHPTVAKAKAPIRQNVTVTNISSKSVVRTPAPKVQQPKFTNEELYAYNQLMIALSITSSKLKIVKDKVNGTDGQGSDVTTTR